MPRLPLRCHLESALWFAVRGRRQLRSRAPRAAPPVSPQVSGPPARGEEMGRIFEKGARLASPGGFQRCTCCCLCRGGPAVGPASVTMPCTCQVPAGVSPATLLMGCEAGGCGPSRLPLALFSLLGVPGRPKPGASPHPSDCSLGPCLGPCGLRFSVPCVPPASPKGQWMSADVPRESSQCRCGLLAITQGCMGPVAAAPRLGHPMPVDTPGKPFLLWSPQPLVLCVGSPLVPTPSLGGGLGRGCHSGEGPHPFLRVRGCPEMVHGGRCHIAML